MSIRNILPKSFSKVSPRASLNTGPAESYLPRLINPGSNEIRVICAAVVEAVFPRLPGQRRDGSGDSGAKLRYGFRAEKLF